MDWWKRGFKEVHVITSLARYAPNNEGRTDQAGIIEKVRPRLKSFAPRFIFLFAHLTY